MDSILIGLLAFLVIASAAFGFFGASFLVATIFGVIFGVLAALADDAQIFG